MVVLMDLALLEKIAAIENVIGVKEENGERAVYEAILAGLNHLLPIIGAGGAMRRFINDAKLGAFTYLVGIGSFRPDLAMTFYRAVMAGDEARATAIAAAYEDPYFAKAVSYGWHRALKETLHVLGLMPPYERAPLERVDREPLGERRLDRARGQLPMQKEQMPPPLKARGATFGTHGLSESIDHGAILRRAVTSEAATRSSAGSPRLRWGSCRRSARRPARAFRATARLRVCERCRSRSRDRARCRGRAAWS